MKKNILYLIALAMITMLGSCSQEEIETYNSPTGINFLASDGNGGFTDNYQNLSKEINLYTEYMNTMDIKDVELKVGFQVEGLIPDKDMKVAFTSEAVDGFEKLDIQAPTDTVVKAGTYMQTATILCQKPAGFGKTYATNICFDYANSDFVAGTKERQKFKVIIKDETLWEDMWVEDENEWNEYFSSTIGKYGPMKVRFVLYALAKKGLSYSSINYKYYYTVTYPSYGLVPQLDYLQSELEAYNASHGTPLTEPDGTVVSFK